MRARQISESFLGHAEGDDDVHVVACWFFCDESRAQRRPSPASRLIIHQIGDLENPAAAILTS